jgi:two-component system response regulator NreC
MAVAAAAGSIVESPMRPPAITEPPESVARASEHGWLRAVPPDAAEASAETPINILLADDHTFVRRSLRALLDADRELQVVGEAADLAMAVRQAQSQGPHVLVLDVGMQAGAILSVIRELRARAPETAIVVTTMTDDPRFAREVLYAGASAYVLTDSADRDLATAVHAAARGEQFIPSELAQLMRVYESGVDALSGREIEVLRLIGLGHTNSEIGELLSLSVRTVESHRASIHRKLGLTTRAELVRYALRRGLLAPELSTDVRGR